MDRNNYMFRIDLLYRLQDILFLENSHTYVTHAFPSIYRYTLFRFLTLLSFSPFLVLDIFFNTARYAIYLALKKKHTDYLEEQNYVSYHWLFITKTSSGYPAIQILMNA